MNTKKILFLSMVIMQIFPYTPVFAQDLIDALLTDPEVLGNEEGEISEERIEELRVVLQKIRDRRAKISDEMDNEIAAKDDEIAAKDDKIAATDRENAELRNAMYILAQKLQNDEKAGDVPEQNPVKRQIHLFGKGWPEVINMILQFGTGTKAAQMAYKAGAIATTKVVLPVAGVATVTYLSYQLDRAQGLSRRNDEIGKKIKPYEKRLRELLECTGPVSSVNPCGGYTNKADLDAEIKNVTENINKLFMQAQKNVQELPSPNKDAFNPRHGKFRYYYLTPLLHGWDMVNPF